MTKEGDDDGALGRCVYWANLALSPQTKKPNASVSIPGDEPEYASRECWVCVCGTKVYGGPAGICSKCGADWYYQPNAPADLPVAAGMVRQDVGVCPNCRARIDDDQGFCGSERMACPYCGLRVIPVFIKPDVPANLPSVAGMARQDVECSLELLELRARLNKYEWSDVSGGVEYCPCCKADKATGHSAWCDLYAPKAGFTIPTPSSEKTEQRLK